MVANSTKTADPLGGRHGDIIWLALVAMRMQAGFDDPGDGVDVGRAFGALVADYWARCATEQLLVPPERSTWIDVHEMASGLDRLAVTLGIPAWLVVRQAREKV